MENEIQRLANNRSKPGEVFTNKNKKAIFVGEMRKRYGCYKLLYTHSYIINKFTYTKQIAIRWLKKGY